ncbi:hypothetical protein V6N13_144849 [Hibiscus sabdariffa]
MCNSQREWNEAERKVALLPGDHGIDGEDCKGDTFLYYVKQAEMCEDLQNLFIEAKWKLSVQLLNNPSIDEFRLVLESSEPNIVYFQGEQNADDEDIGSLVWEDIPEAIFFGSTLPTIVRDARFCYFNCSLFDLILHENCMIKVLEMLEIGLGFCSP